MRVWNSTSLVGRSWMKMEGGVREAQKRSWETLALSPNKKTGTWFIRSNAQTSCCILFPFIQIWPTSTFLKPRVSLTLTKGTEGQELRHGNTGQVQNVTNVTEKSTQIVGREDIFPMTKFPNPFGTLQNPTTLVFRRCRGTCRRLLKPQKQNGHTEEFWAQSGDSTTIKDNREGDLNGGIKNKHRKTVNRLEINPTAQ